MAKQKVLPNKTLVEARADRVKNCKQCGGTPATSTCNLQGLIFQRCDECFEIVGDYKKEGAPIKIKSKRDLGVNHVDPNFNKQISMETIPGIQGVSFGDLEIIE